MKRTLFAAAIAAAALASAPAFAQGYVGAQAANMHIDAAGSSANGNVYDVFGSVVTPLTDTMAFQFDGDVNWNNIDGLDHAAAGGATIHAYHETPNNKVGGFIGAAAENGDTLWNGGLEAQLFPSDNFNLGGGVGYFNDHELDVEGWAAAANGTVFINDNLDVYANGGFAQGSIGNANNVFGWGAGAGVEYQLSTVPMSFYLGYDHSDIHDFDAKADEVSVGVTYSWSGSLKERERRGPSLRGISYVAGLFK